MKKKTIKSTKNNVYRNCAGDQHDDGEAVQRRSVSSVQGGVVPCVRGDVEPAELRPGLPAGVRRREEDGRRLPGGQDNAVQGVQRSRARVLDGTARRTRQLSHLTAVVVDGTVDLSTGERVSALRNSVCAAVRRNKD